MKIIFSLIAVICVALLAVGLFAPTFEVRISQQMIQDQVKNHLPISVTEKGVTGSISEARIQLVGADVVNIAANGSLRGYGERGDISADLSTKVIYRDRGFYLSQIQLDDFKLQLEVDTQKSFQEKRSLLNALKDKALDKFSDGNLEIRQMAESQLAALLDQAKQKLAESLENKLRSTPVFHLSQLNGNAKIASYALSDLRLEKEELVATLSPGHFISFLGKQVLIIIFALLAAFALLGAIFFPFARGQK